MKKYFKLISLILVLTMLTGLVAYAAPEDDEAVENDLSIAEAVMSITDGVFIIEIGEDMQMTVYRDDGAVKTPMTAPIENLGAAGATAVNTAPWKGGLPWSSGTGTGTSDLHNNSAKLLSPKSGYITRWTGTGSRIASGNGQFEALLTDEFAVTGSTFEKDIAGHFGKGDRLTVVGENETLGLQRRLVIETSYAVPGAAAVSTYYKYIGEDPAGIAITKFVENNFRMVDVTPTRVNGNNIDAGIWTFQGGATSWGRDFVMPVFDTMGINGASNFTQGNASWNSPNINAQQRNNWFTSSDACIPYNNYYGTNIGLGLGSAMPYHVFGLELPTRGSGITGNHNNAYAWVGWPGKTLTPTTPVAGEYIGTSIITVHSGDFYDGNSLYASAMAQIDIKNQNIHVNNLLDNAVEDYLVLPSSDEMPDWAWAPVGESWGYGTGFSVTNLMDKVHDYKELGIKSLTLDAHWFIPSSNSGGAANYNLLPSRWQPVLNRLRTYEWQDPDLAAYYVANPLPEGTISTHTQAKRVVRGYTDWFKDHDILLVAWTVGAGIQPNIVTAALQVGSTRADKLHLFAGLNGKAVDALTQADIDSVTAQNATGGFVTNDGARYPCFANPQFLEVFAFNYAKYIFEELGFSGMKIDSTYGNPLCYATNHGHTGDPEACMRSYGTFHQRLLDYANYFRGATEVVGGPMVDRQKATVIMHCACGQPMNYFSWGGTNRPVPGDSVGARQQRYMVKSYKGFYDATFPVVGDHLYLSKLNTTSEGQRAGPPDYISHMGVGAVYDTKFRTQRYNSFSGNGEFTTNQDMLYPGQTGFTTITGTGTPGTVNRTYRWNDFIKYFGLYNDLLISKAEFINLYKYGFDYPEAYAFKVDDSNFIHSFYATTNQVSAGFKSGLVNDPWGSAYYSNNRYTNSNGVELRGLKANTNYFITNVENGNQWTATSDAAGNIAMPGVTFATGIILKTSEVQTASLSGTVTNGAAIVPGAELKLLNPDGSPVAGVSPTAADLNGFYCFPIVPAGSYIISATANKGSNGLPYPGVTAANTFEMSSVPFRVGTGPYTAPVNFTSEKVEAWTEGAVKTYLDYPVEYSIKLRANEVLPNANAFAITVTVDNLSYKGDYEALDGFVLLKGPTWKEQDDGSFQGTFMFGQYGNGINVDGEAVLAKLSFEAVGTGVATLTLDEVYLTTQADAFSMTEKTFAFISALNRTVVTEIIEIPEFIAVYSKYDLNKDGEICLLDISIALRAFLIEEDDDEWDVGISVDKLGKAITAALCDVNGDGVVDMLDIADILAHFGPAPPDMIDPRD